MRTNVVLNDELVEEAMKLSTVKSKSALIEESLRFFVASRQAENRRAQYGRRVLELQQKLSRSSPRQSAHEIVERDRQR